MILSSILSSAAPTHQPTAPSYSYVVKRQDILGYVSLRNYGTSRMWRKIARWNGISDPRKIKVGTRLVLRIKPRISLQAGNRLVAAEWARHKAQKKKYARLQPAAAPRTVARVAPAPPLAVSSNVYKKGNFKEAAKLFKAARTQNPSRVTEWLYELSSLKLSGNRKEFMTLRRDFLKRFPTLAHLELVRPIGRLPANH